ncbi:MAG: flagellar basal body P-ring formation protein FlgA [Bdellovibrionales bacterium]|nr:flagellar basal body P-ring formation protein FlgA [Bdellovibrionales bacterium]
MKSLSFVALTTLATVLADLGERHTMAAMNDVAPNRIELATPAVAAALVTAENAVAQNIRSQIARQMALTVDSFRVDVDHLRFVPALTGDRIKSVQVLGLGTTGGHRLDGLFNLPVIVEIETKNGVREQEHQLSGILKVTGPVYTAKANLPRGHVITKEDIALSDLPWRTLPTGALGLAERSLVGQRVKSMVTSGEAFQLQQIDEPLAVKSGETVEVTVISGPGVLIRSRGVARQEGKTGDVIRIEQPDSKKMLTGQVTGDKAVEVRL